MVTWMFRPASKPRHPRRTRRPDGSLVRELLFRGAMLLPLVALALVTVAPISVVRAGGATAWSGGLTPSSPTEGLVAATTVKDGASGLAQFHYRFDLCTGPVTPVGCGGSGVSERTLYFATVADDPGQIRVNYTFTGFHAYAGVKVGLTADITSVLSEDSSTTLIADGPVSCCTPPSAGFTYTGSHTFDVQHGDTFGFTITGSNGDATSILEGTLTVGISVVDNGSFELGTPDDNTDNLTRLSPGSTNLHGWTVDPADIIPSGNTAEVDWTGTRWPASDAARSLELTGGPSAGAIYEDLPTIVGQDYVVSFDYSANPDRLSDSPTTECGSAPAANPGVAVVFDGVQLNGGSHVVYSTPNSFADMKWAAFSEQITAQHATSRLRFFATTFPDDGCGAVLDNVRVVPVLPSGPPPADAPQPNDGSWVVNSAADHNDGVCGTTDCTLREAILASNGFVSATPNSITFAIPGSGSHTIPVTTTLPALSKPVLIDGTTQTGATCGPNLASTLKIHVDGSGGGSEIDGLLLNGFADGSTIKGVVVEGFSGVGIESSADHVVVQCSVIGTSAHPNHGVGVDINQGSSNLVGSNNDGTNDAAEANEISHNGTSEGAPGIAVVNASSNNRLDGNSIHDNGGLGIDLADDGPTANDTGDGDAGPNGLQNTPELIRVEAGTNAGIAGRFAVATGQSADISFFISNACDTSGFGEGATRIGTATVTGDANGLANFAIAIAGLPVGNFVTATATSAGGATSEFSACAKVGNGNDSWPNALDISSLGSGSDALSYSGQTRWYKFQITPGAQVTVNLGSLPADYDLLLFKDIQAAYAALNSGDPTVIAAQFSGTGQKFSGTGQKFSGTGQKFSDDVFSGTGQKFSGTGQKFSGDLGFSGDAFSGTGQKFSAGAFAGTGQKFSPDAVAGTGQKFSPDAYSGAQALSLLDFSANTGPAPESITSNTWNNAGFFYVRVSGRGGVFDPTDLFNVTKSQTGADCLGLSTFSAEALPAPTGTGIQTVILTDSSRLAGSAPGSTLATQLTTFKQRPEIQGAVVDVAGNLRLLHLNQQADGHANCPYAKNLVAVAFKQIVDSYRTSSNSLKYVVLVGGDNVVPFFRYPDTSTLGPESSYLPPVGPLTASEASLRLNYVLSQDAYGAKTLLPQAAGSFPVGDLAVGRLVETASEASTVLGAYLGTSGGTVATPTRSLVTGYDFMTDGATSVQTDLSLGLGTGTGVVKDTLIAPNNILPTDPQSWTATQLRTKLLSSGRHDLIFLAGHFSANRALAADFDTTILASEVANSTTDFTNSIVFSQGCHSGYGIVDADAIPSVTDNLDWAQAFARKGATLIAGTGYQYGDTDLVQYSEQIYAEFAHQLRVGSGPVSVGNALLAAKKTYLKNTPTLDGVDVKALLESSVFGLPMLSVNLPANRDTSSTGGGITPTPVPGSTLGLSTSDLTVPTGAGVTTSVPKVLKNLDGTTGPTATYYVGPNGQVVTSPNEPVLPLVATNVTATGTTLRGVGFRGGSYTDTPGITPLVTDPATEVRTPHTGFQSSILWPIQIAIPNYFDALSGGQTRLLVTPVQHRSDALPATTDTLRRFSNVDVRLFYSSNTSAAALSGPPSILDTSATSAGSTVTFSVHVAGDPAAKMQGVWVTYTGWTSQWVSKDLTQDPLDPSHWTVSIASGGSTSDLRFISQAASGTGLVSLDTNSGAFYSVATGTTATPAVTHLSLAGTPISGAFGTSATFTATLTNSGPLSSQPVDFSLGGVTKTGVTNASGQASATFTLNGAAATYPLTASFAGTTAYAASADSGSFSITKVGTTIVLSGPDSTTLGQPTGVVANLKDNNAPGNALGSQTVWFVVSNGTSAQTKAVITDYLGNAPLGTLTLPAGNYTVAAYFQGTFTLLPSTTTITLTDSAYGPSSKTKPLGIYWPFTGFFSPVDNLPTINNANAGQAIPVKFALGGNRGTTMASLFLTGYPKAVIDSCSTTSSDDIETYVTATSNSLSYDASSGQYTFVWKTDKATMAGKCVRLDLGLIDGSTRSAQFKFK